MEADEVLGSAFIHSYCGSILCKTVNNTPPTPSPAPAVAQALVGLCIDREWSVREAAVRSVVMVDCGFKHVYGHKDHMPSNESFTKHIHNEEQLEENKVASLTFPRRVRGFGCRLER